ncbi:hypothetical protein MHU86_9223 [Fragilaria crotonensis]|nr:hypothetical protein MHU86_9223 [Fragilaria crotonensis]
MSTTTTTTSHFKSIHATTTTTTTKDPRSHSHHSLAFSHNSHRYLDDKTSRKHKVPVIIGGSDGSGTRAFVDLLARLGVPMLLDDPISMDIDGSLLCERQGWPPLAKMALVNRKLPVDQWPEIDRNQSRTEMEKLRHVLDVRFARRMRRLAAVDHVNTSKLATKVLFGFKAPITMLLVPMIQAYMYPTGFKYIHVVRDGRDVALSSNQSPVKKFYTSTYKDDAHVRMETYRNTTHVLAMQLWNDWNVGLHEWATTEKQRIADAAAAARLLPKIRKRNQQDHHYYTSFDYLLVRSEDFLNPETKFQSLQVLAKFVGSTLTNQELCCLSQRQSRDMGQSHVFNYNNTNDNNQTLRRVHKHPASILKAAVLEQKRRGISTTTSGALSDITAADHAHRRLLLDNEDPRRRLFELELLERQLIQHRGQWTPEMAAEHGGLRHVDHSQNKSKYDRTDSLKHHDRHMDELRLRAGRGRGPPLDYGDEALGKLMMEQLEALYARKTLSKNRTVTERYGKWSTLLEPNSTLFLLFHSEGAKGLQLFGYEPRKETIYEDAASTNSNYICRSNSSADMDIQCGPKKMNVNRPTGKIKL